MLQWLETMLHTMPSCAGGDCKSGRVCPMPEACARGRLEREQERWPYTGQPSRPIPLTEAELDAHIAEKHASPAPRIPRVVRPAIEIRGGERLIFKRLTLWRRLVWAYREWRARRMRPQGVR